MVATFVLTIQPTHSASYRERRAVRVHGRRNRSNMSNLCVLARQSSRRLADRIACFGDAVSARAPRIRRLL